MNTVQGSSAGLVRAGLIVTMLVGCNPGSGSTVINDPPDNSSSFRIGVDISGLVGDGLELALNGGEPVAVAGTHFEFAQPLLDGSDYSVTLAQDPDDQLCRLYNANGTLSGAAITDIQLQCRSWGVAEELSKKAARYFQPAYSLVVNSDGKAVAVWTETSSDDDNNKLVAASYDPEQPGWGANDPIGKFVTSDIQNDSDTYIAAGATNQAGQTLMVWEEALPSGYFPKARFYSTEPTPAWGAEIPIENLAGYTSNPAVALDPDGGAVAVWERLNGNKRDIRANRFDPESKTWLTAAETIESGAGTAGGPQIALDAEGNGLAVWGQKVGEKFYVMSRAYSRSGWGAAEQRIDGGVPGNNDTPHPQLAMDAEGNALVLWHTSFTVEDQDGNSHQETSIAVNHYQKGQGWSEAVQLFSGDKVPGNDRNRTPKLAVNADGRALAVWWQNSKLLAVGYQPGKGWDTSVQIIDEDIVLFASALTMDDLGNAILVWAVEVDLDSSVLLASRYSVANGNWSKPMLVQPAEDQSQRAAIPIVGFDADSRATVAWMQGNKFYTRRFE